MTRELFNQKSFVPENLLCWSELLGQLRSHPMCFILPEFSCCPANYLSCSLNAPLCLPIPASSSSHREYLALKLWHDIHFHIGTLQWPKHTIISSAQDGAQWDVLITVFLLSSHGPEIKAKGIQKMTAQGNWFFINVLSSQVYSRAIALLQCRKTLALTSDYSTGLGLPSSPVLGDDA